MSATDDWHLKNHVQIIPLDYANAFKLINLNILIKKLSDLGIPNILLCWIEQFLMGHFQQVKMGHTFSEWIELWVSVPPGTLLSVRCFLCMIHESE